MQLQYLLDTDICIYIAKNKPSNVLKKLEKLSVGQVGMSVITYGELLFGTEKSKLKQHSLQILEQLTRIIKPVDLSLEASTQYAKIRSSLEQNGNIIGNNDLWIAAHCLSLNLILVTNNKREFSRIPSLKVETWV